MPRLVVVVVRRSSSSSSCCCSCAVVAVVALVAVVVVGGGGGGDGRAHQQLHAVFVLAMRLWLWLPLSLWSTPTQPRSQEARTLQSQEERKLLNASRQKKAEKQKSSWHRICNMFSTFERQPSWWRCNLSFCMTFATFGR